MTDAATDIGLPAFTGAYHRRRLAIVLSLVLVLLAAGAALFLVRHFDNQLDDMGRTYEVRKLARELIISVTEAESGRRGYILTGDPAYLEAYERGTAGILSNYDQANAVLDEDIERQAAFKALKDDLDRKRAEMAATVELAGSGRRDEALLAFRSREGKALTDSIRTTLRLFIDQEDLTLQERNAQVQSYRQWLVASILAALAGSAVLAYALFNRTQKQVSALARTRTLLLQQNEELEEHVRRRTAEVEEARAHAERERQRVEALLQDTNHRVGNSLATVSSLLGLQLQRSRSEEVRRALEAAQNRVQAIASGHRRLRLGADLETTKADEFLDAVVEDLKASHAIDVDVEFNTRFEPIVIKARDATTIGILLGELVTNALKHAFSDGRKGRVWAILARDVEGVITLTVEDDGKGFEGESDESGLGSLIIRQLAMQFGGKPAHRPRQEGGSIVSVTLPALEREDDLQGTPRN